ncbi:MAG: Crp/Fnr family transcriptional regulator [Candidatus Methylomirabilales bacterium]
MVKDPEVVVLHDVLGIVPLFQELTPEELDRIIALGRLVTYSKGAMLFVEGDPGEALYIVVDGSVRIGKNVPGAKEEAMAFIERGGCFGEMALFDEFPRSATAIAHQECRVLFIEKQAFLDLLRGEPVIGRKILWAFCRTLSVRLRETTDRIVALFALARPF